jgi:hypothetical protein
MPEEVKWRINGNTLIFSSPVITISRFVISYQTTNHVDIWKDSLDGRSAIRSSSTHTRQHIGNVDKEPWPHSESNGLCGYCARYQKRIKNLRLSALLIH